MPTNPFLHDPNHIKGREFYPSTQLALVQAGEEREISDPQLINRALLTFLQLIFASCILH